jgi:hypothetical protein
MVAGTIGGLEEREHDDTNAQTLQFAFREKRVVRADGPRKVSTTIILLKTRRWEWRFWSEFYGGDSDFVSKR